MTEDDLLAALKVTDRIPVTMVRKPASPGLGTPKYKLEISSAEGFAVPAERLNEMAFNERTIQLCSVGSDFWITARRINVS